MTAPYHHPMPPPPPPAPRKTHRLRWFLLSVLGVFVALVLIGALADNGTTTPSPAVTVPSVHVPRPVVSPAATSHRAIFLAVADAHTGGIYNHGPMLAIAHAECKALNQGLPVLTVQALAVQAAQANGVDTGDTGFMLGAAIAAFCPQHTAEAKALSGS